MPTSILSLVLRVRLDEVIDIVMFVIGGNFVEALLIKLFGFLDGGVEAGEQISVKPDRVEHILLRLLLGQV